MRVLYGRFMGDWWPTIQMSMYEVIKPFDYQDERINITMADIPAEKGKTLTFGSNPLLTMVQVTFRQQRRLPRPALTISTLYLALQILALTFCSRLNLARYTKTSSMQILHFVVLNKIRGSGKADNLILLPT